MKGTGPVARLVTLGVAAVVAIGPLPFGSVTPIGRLMLALLAVVLGVALVLGAGRLLPRPDARRLTWVLVGAAGLALVGLAQIAGAGTAIPVAEAAASPAPLVPRSLAPVATLAAIRAGAPLVVFLVAAFVAARSGGLRTIAIAALLSAAFQGLYGSLELVTGSNSIGFYAKRYYLDCATGTYINRNHFAGFLAMTLPLGLALALEHASGGRRRSAVSDEAFRRWTVRGLYVLLIVFGVIGLLLSFSRTGILLGVLALAGMAAVRRRRGVRFSVLVALLVAAAAAIPVVQIGTDKLVARYGRASADLASAQGRVAVWRDSLGAIRDRPLWGSGFGSFESVYALYSSPEIRSTYDHAHNDLLEFVFESGAIGLVLLAAIVAPVSRRLVRALSGSRGALFLGAGAGLAAALLHALVDFNFHIPANAATAAVLAGIVLAVPDEAPRTPVPVILAEASSAGVRPAAPVP